MTVRSVRLFSITCQHPGCHRVEHYTVPQASTPAAYVRIQAGIEGWVHDGSRDLCPGHAEHAQPPRGREVLRQRSRAGDHR